MDNFKKEQKSLMRWGMLLASATVLLNVILFCGGVWFIFFMLQTFGVI